VFRRDFYEDGLKNETSWELLMQVKKDIQFNSVYCDGVILKDLVRGMRGRLYKFQVFDAGV